MSMRPEDVLYAGADLQRAAAESTVCLTVADRLAGLRNACAVGTELAAARLRRSEGPGYELVVAAAKGERDGQALTAVYAGTGANRDWCLSNVFTDYEVVERTEADAPEGLAGALAEAGGDVVFTEPLPGPVVADPRAPSAGRGVSAGPPLTFVMPAWVKQRLRVLDDWPRQLAGLRRDTRQEVSRMLRNYGYTCRLSRDPADHADFYDRLYQPYVSRRFGGAALVVDRGRFLAECRRGVLLRLLLRDDVIGTALLRPLGRTLAVVWSALDPSREPGRLRGATDAMDYFSLLYAHLRGCRWLDFGPSRPDLFDGALRYKAKWGAGVYAGLVPQAEIRCTCSTEAPERLDFLTRHVFLVRRHDGLRGLFFVGGGTEPEAFRNRLSAVLTEGVRDYRVIALSAPDERLRAAVDSIDADVTLEVLQRQAVPRTRRSPTTPATPAG